MNGGGASLGGAPAGDRTAFRLWPVHEHRARGSTISALALSADGGKLYIGLSDGELEEHRIVSALSGAHLSLTARKHVSKKPVMAILHLERAGRLAVLCDGQLLLLDADTLEGHPLPGVKGITAVASEAASGLGRAPTRLALALKAGRRLARIAVYHLTAGGGAGVPLGATARLLAQMDLTSALPVQAMAWLGPKLVACTSLEYLLLDVAADAATRLFALPAEAPPPTLIKRLPGGSPLAILLMDQVGIIVDAEGQPTRSALTFPSLPRTLAAAGLFVVSAAQEGLSVFQWGDATCVQRLGYGSAGFPSPGEGLLTADGPPGGSIALAGHRKVWLLRGVALEEQAAQLLRLGDAGAALALADAAQAPWAPIAAAEAAFLLIHSCRFAEAFAAARRCRPPDLQPREFFPLAPQHLDPARQPARRRWGLAQPLNPLEATVSRAASHAGLDPERLLHEGRRQLADYLLWARGQSGVDQPDGVDTLLVHLLADLRAGPEIEALAAAGCAADLAQLRGRLAAERQLAGLAALSAAAGEALQALRLWQDIEQSEGGAARASAAAHAAALLADERRADEALALAFLPWLAQASPAEALTVLTSRPLPPAETLQLLRGAPGESQNSTGDLHWQYLEHLVAERSSRDPALHTELASALAAAALPLLPPPSPHARPGKRRVAAAVSGSPVEAAAAGPAAERLAGLRGRLQGHLQASGLVDGPALLQQLRGSAMWEEQVLLHSKAGGHQAALRILALVLGDIAAAEAYCREHLGPAGYRQLLGMLLAPGPGAPPMLPEACHLLAAAGEHVDLLQVLEVASPDACPADAQSTLISSSEHLDPLQVLEAVPAGASLADAQATLAAVLGQRQHAVRQGALLRQLRKSAALAATSTRAEVMSRRVATSVERSCQRCHTRIGTKMFAVYPNGVLVCFKCQSKTGDSVDPVSGRDFTLQPHSTSEAWPD